MPKPIAGTTMLLVKVGEDKSGACTIEKYEWFSASPEQAQAYCNGVADWRNAKPKTAWASRLWRRLTGDA